MNTRWTHLSILALVCIALAAGITGGSALAQNLFAEEGQSVYSGQPAAASGVTLGAWGSGSCKESALNTYAGSYSLEITPKDLYAGGRIDFMAPVDITSSFNDPTSYLQLVTRFGGAQAGYDAFGMNISAVGSTDIYGGTARAGKQVRKVRIVLYLEDGSVVESQVDVASFKLSEDGWMKLSFPLAVLKGKLELPAYKVKRLVITGDGSEPFYIGEIKTVRDNTPLEANAGEEMEVARLYANVFHGFAQTGASAVKYTWDFNAVDGVQEESVGDLIYHRFSQAGSFVVTLTVSDVFGLKKPSTSTISVKVNE